MIVGLRPEHFSDARLGGGGTELPATVEITEQLGSETLVYFRVEGVSAVLTSGDSEAALGGAFVARLDPRTRPQTGDRLQLALDLERAQFFEPAGGQSLRTDRP